MLGKKMRVLMSQFSFDVTCPTVRGNVLELPVVRFETVVYRNATNNDTMFNGLLQRKINVFREATLFAKALMSARITGRCCYKL